MDEMYNYLLKRIKEVEKERDAYKTASNAAEQIVSDIRAILANIPTETYDGRVKDLRERQEYALSKIIHIVYPEGMALCADLFYDERPQLRVITR